MDSHGQNVVKDMSEALFNSDFSTFCHTGIMVSLIVFLDGGSVPIEKLEFLNESVCGPGK